ncbi:MAG: hypothetical protein M9887_04275 [Chitinophagales bacterium]|nr:hypothetical protein [Chitinophagales bacterium]
MLLDLFKKKVDRDCFVICTEITKTTLSVSALVKEIEDYFSAKDIKFTHGGYTTSTYKDYDGKIDSFKKKIRENISYVYLNITRRNANEEIELSVDIAFGYNQGIMIYFNHGLIDFSMSDFTKYIHSYFSIEYGYMYYGRKDKYPEIFAIGSGQYSKYVKGTTKTSEEDIAKWNKERHMVKDGYYRDIFATNIISQTHLKKEIASKSVHQIIDENNLGQLNHIIDDLYSWILNEDELKRARSIFYKSNLVL